MLPSTVNSITSWPLPPHKSHRPLSFARAKWPDSACHALLTAGTIFDAGPYSLSKNERSYTKADLMSAFILAKTGVFRTPSRCRPKLGQLLANPETSDYFKAIHWAPDVPRLVHQSLRRELAAIEDELNRLYTRVSLPVPVTTRYTGPCATMFTVLHGNRSSSRHLSSYKKSIIRVHAFVRPWYGLDKELVHAEVAIPGAAEVHYTTITFMGPVPESTVTMDTFVGQGNVFGVSVVASGRLRISNPDPSNSEHVKRFDDALVVQSFQARRDGGTRQPTSFLDVLYTFQLAKTAADVGVDIWMPEEDLPPPPILMAPEVELHGPIPKRAEAVGWLPPWCWRLEADPPPRSATFCHLDCGDSSKERLPVSLDIGDNTTFCDADFFVDCPPFLDFPESARYYDLFTSDVE